MHSCDDYHGLMLDYLYGLLDEADVRELRGHVDGCATCQTQLAAAQAHKTMLAKAAQVYRTVPPFAPPRQAPIEVGAQATPAPVGILTLPPRRKLLRRPLPWAMAAAILLLIGGWGMLAYRASVTALTEEVAAIHLQEAANKAQLAQLHKELDQKRQALPPTLQAQVIHLQATGPAYYHADASNQVRVATRALDGQPLPTTVTASLVDAGSQKELYRAPAAVSPGEVLVHLPPGLPVQNGQMVQLKVAARSTEANTEVFQTLQAAEPEHVTHLAVNKSTLQIGDMLFYRAVTLQRFSLRPPPQPLLLRHILVDSQGRVVRETIAPTTTGGISSGEFVLTPELANGTYTLEISGVGPTAAKVAPQRRPLKIWREPPPPLHFDRPEYMAGDKAKVEFLARRKQEKKNEVNPPLTVPQVTVDGRPVQANGAGPGKPLQVRPDARGNINLQVQLPNQFEKRQAVVEIQVRDGQRDEKLTQAIPVVPSTLDVEFFPEGGTLLAGAPNRVYYRVRTPAGEPVEPEGHVILLSSQEVLFDSPRKQGQGVFTFTPDPKETYTLRITASQGGRKTIEKENAFQEHPLRTEGVALHVPTAVSREGEPLKIVVHTLGKPRPLVLVAACRGRVVDQHWLPGKVGKNEVTLTLAPATRGVVRLTLYEPAGQRLNPLAERLIYRMPKEHLVLTTSAAKQVYHAGETVQLQFQARDEKGQPAPAWLLAAVVDERALSSADRRNRSLAANFLLLSDVQNGAELDDADLLVADSPQARVALDLFLGTQGWRRFVPREESTLVAKEAEGIPRKNEKAAMMAQGAGQRVPAAVALFNRENDSLVGLKGKYHAALTRALDELNHEVGKREVALREETQQLRVAALAAATRLAEWQNRPWEYLRLAVASIFVVLLFIGGVLLLWGLWRLVHQTPPSRAFAGSFASLALSLVIFSLRGFLPIPGEMPEGDSAGPIAQLKDGKIPEGPLPLPFLADAPLSGVFMVPPAKTASALPPPPTRGSLGPMALAKADRLEAGRAGGAGNLEQAKDAARLREFFNRPERQKSPAALYKGAVQPPAISQPRVGPSSPAGMPSFAPGAAHVLGEGQGSFQRQYAFRRSAVLPYPDTLLWSPALQTEKGAALVSFDLPNVATTYRVLLYGHTANGRLGFSDWGLRVAE